MGYGIQGIPMIASSPVRHDSPLNLHGLEVTSYQPPWKALSDFALHADLDNNGALNHTPAFQHLVNQASHHHFSSSYAVLFFSRRNIRKSFSIMTTFISLRPPLCIHTFFPFRFSSLNTILYYLFACRSGFFCLNFFFSFVFCLDIYSFNIFLVC